MNRFDLEFWNGFLKGIIAAEQEIKDLEERKTADNREGIALALSAIQNLKSKVEDLHGEDVRKFLREWK
ncbi:MAG: hypothetical protein QXU98_14380 [Candidatus Parvarchaeota archaeon]